MKFPQDQYCVDKYGSFVVVVVEIAICDNLAQKRKICTIAGEEEKASDIKNNIPTLF